MSKKKFIVKEEEGVKFSKLSGDDNKIHIDRITGYNSIFGEKICHGCLIILKIFKILNLKKILNKLNEYNIEVKFEKHFSYNKEIFIKTKKFKNKIISQIFQNKKLVASILVSNKNKLLNNKFTNISKIFKKKDNLINFYNKENNLGKLSMALCTLTKYAGKVYPGENSIINQININYNKSFKFSKNKMHIFSKKMDKRLPIILNKLVFQKYNIEFKTSERPKLKLKLKKINNYVKEQVNKITDNVLIVGASSGIGFDVLNILKFNKRIKILSTYNKNKINLNNKNIIKIKIDLAKNIYKIKKILKKYSPLIIYYFATPKININLNDQNSMQVYKKFYIDFPLKIISFSQNREIKFFYPSTVFASRRETSNYTKAKRYGEIILNKANKRNVEINICRIDEINTKQNLSILDRNLPNFRDLLNKNQFYQKKFFFI